MDLNLICMAAALAALGIAIVFQHYRHREAQRRARETEQHLACHVMQLARFRFCSLSQNPYRCITVDSLQQALSILQNDTTRRALNYMIERIADIGHVVDTRLVTREEVYTGAPHSPVVRVYNVQHREPVYGINLEDIDSYPDRLAAKFDRGAAVLRPDRTEPGSVASN